ncbi:hypothetical protein DVR14_05275 [Natrinema thermotolerans]|nr:hypothetical protein DVR14_05275 [Natrinema thermotolerans]
MSVLAVVRWSPTGARAIESTSTTVPIDSSSRWGDRPLGLELSLFLSRRATKGPRSVAQRPNYRRRNATAEALFRSSSNPRLESDPVPSTTPTR